MNPVILRLPTRLVLTTRFGVKTKKPSGVNSFLSYLYQPSSFQSKSPRMKSGSIPLYPPPLDEGPCRVINDLLT